MDASKFREMVLPLSGRLYRYAERFLGNSHEAEDIVQDIWMKLWERKEMIGELKSLDAYAFRITRNLCLDRIKLKKPQYYDDRQAKALGLDGADQRPDPHLSLELKDTLEKMHRIIGSLPEQQQTLIQLRDIEGLEYEDIAEVTGLEVNAIRVNISRARKKLRESLQKYDRT